MSETAKVIYEKEETNLLGEVSRAHLMRLGAYNVRCAALGLKPERLFLLKVLEFSVIQMEERGQEDGSTTEPQVSDESLIRLSDHGKKIVAVADWLNDSFRHPGVPPTPATPAGSQARTHVRRRRLTQRNMFPQFD